MFLFLTSIYYYLMQSLPHSRMEDRYITSTNGSTHLMVCPLLKTLLWLWNVEQLFLYI